ncbi:MAG: carbohydrate ABC transporter permease [Planctomycetes bacterium]|nr:carbohydrate ABC transporter permease [Planctomycetota bacterium]
MVEPRGIPAITRRLTLYALLIGGSILFSIPFGWLLLSSFKPNEEQYTRWLPRTPPAVAVSPYVARDEFPGITRPRPCPIGRWLEVKGHLVAWTGAAVQDALGGLDPQLHDEVVEGVFFQAARNVADDVWFQSAETLLAKWKAQLTPNLIATCRDRAYKRYLIGPVRVRSLEQQEEILRRGEPISALWKGEGGSRPLREQTAVEGRPCAQLSYFAPEGSREAKLTGVFGLGFPVERMKKLILSLRPDHSWNALDCALEADGQRWASAEPANAGNDQWQDVVWQLPSDDDRSMKVRSWIVLNPAGASDFAEPGKIRVTLTLRGRTRAAAWGTKLANNYRWAFRYMPFWRYVAISFFLCLMNILGQLTGSSLAAYAFARLKWPGREFCFILLLGTIMLPGAVTMVPSFLIFKNLGWYNTLLVLWVPSFCGSAFNIFLLRQFMRGIPKDLEDAAKIDGCSFFGVYRHVILPSIRPALATIAIFAFMGAWNNFMGPLIYLNDQAKYPLALGVFGLQTQVGANYGLIMAASALMALPLVVMFFFCQRYFIQGITLTGMKN